jgi:cell division protein FtsN
MASVTPPAPVTPVAPPAEQIAAPLPTPAPVMAATLDTPPAASAVTAEPKALEILKADPTVRMQTPPKEAQATPAPHDLPAKPEAAPVPEKKVAQAPAPKPAAPAVAEAKPAAAPSSKAASSSGVAPKLITAAARTQAPTSAFYVQAGSFPTEDRAVKSASDLDSMGARVMSGTVDGHAVYRVRIGPFLNIRQANAAIEQAHALGHGDLAIVTE